MTLPRNYGSRALRAAMLAAGLATTLACASAAPPARVDLATTTFAPNLDVDLKSMTRLQDGLYHRDLQPGSGPLASDGKRVSVQYTGWLANGTQFETNASPTDPPVTFQLGKGEVISGWERGIRGMRVGGRRLLVIGPELGYGRNSRPKIPANSVLVFDVLVMRVF